MTLCLYVAIDVIHVNFMVNARSIEELILGLGWYVRVL